MSGVARRGWRGWCRSATVTVGDLTAEEAVEQVLARLGTVVAPGVLEGRDPDGRPFRLLFDEADLARRVYQADDIADDRQPHVVPKALHPRRLGVDWFLDQIEERLMTDTGADDDTAEVVLDLRGGRSLWVR